MHVLEVYLESGGYDYKLIKGGISVYTWNLAKALARTGQKVSILTAMHGQKDYLEAEHGLQALDYRHLWNMELQADPQVWQQAMPMTLELDTRAYLLNKEGVDIYILSNQYLDLYPDTYYPPYESKGKDVGFFKPLVFQAEAIHFIRSYFADESMLIHAHEPYYQYLLPPAFASDDSKVMVSTVQSNMPINKKVYLPETQHLLDQLQCGVKLEEETDDVNQSPLGQCMLQYMPKTHLNYSYPDNYINLYSLLLEYSDKIDFLSPGHQQFYQDFYGTAFRALFRQLPVSRQIQQHKHKFFVGGCALSDSWLQADFAGLPEQQVLQDLGLDGQGPVFFHNARYAPNHKGQRELVMAIDQFLSQGGSGNFVLRCVSGTGIDDELFHRLQQKYPSKFALIWQMQQEAELMAMAKAADFCLFPSKFEMDTFLIAQGEAMLAGCVPIASVQLGMQHWQHDQSIFSPEQCTGIGVIRSFAEDDPMLVKSIVKALEQAELLFQQPEKYRAASQRARQHALNFDWHQVARQHLQGFFGRATEQEVQVSSPQDWQQWQLEYGELLSLRAQELQLGQPEIQRQGSLVVYQGEGVQKVLFFQPETHASVEGVKQHSGEFSAECEQPCLCLITLENGDQYWDGEI